MTMPLRIIALSAVGLALWSSIAGCTSPEEGPTAKCPPVAGTPAADAGGRADDARRPGRPNIVVFSIDTLRADHLAVYGYDRPTSPQIDAFAAEAVRFENAVSQAPTTAPAHMSIFTGLMPPVHRVSNTFEGKATALAPGIQSFPGLLREAGYYTVGFHGAGNVSRFLGFDRGFDLYSSAFVSYNWLGVYRDPADLDALRSWIDLSRRRERPLFLFLHHYVCHAPYLSAPDEYRQRFLEGRQVAGLPLGVQDAEKRELAELMDHRVAGRVKRQLHWRLFATAHEQFWHGVDLARRNHRDHIVALYDAGVAYSDFLFGAVRQLLKDEGVYDDTIIVLLSDHGEEFHEHGGREHRQLFVETLHVPLLIRFPSSAGVAPRVVRESVRTIDLMPTLFEHLGLPIEIPVQGQSFLSLVSGEGTYAPQIVSYDDRDFTRIRVADGGLVYTNQLHDEAGEWLFDAAKDPRELRNLARRQPEQLARMREVAGRRLAADAAFADSMRELERRAPTLDPNVVEQLNELGYLQE